MSFILRVSLIQGCPFRGVSLYIIIWTISSSLANDKRDSIGSQQGQRTLLPYSTQPVQGVPWGEVFPLYLKDDK